MNLIKGKKCLITGASSGLGLEVTKLLLQDEAEVIMLCRNESKCKKLIQNLLEKYPKSKLHYEIADFSSLESVKCFIDRFKEKHTFLDVLINNAALLKPKLTKTVDGFESMFQVNYLVPFILTNSLMNLLKVSNSSQIINITLPPEKLRIDFNDLQSLNCFKSMESMFKTKLCFFLYSVELAERLKGTKVNVLTGIPSKRPFKTKLGREMPIIMKFAMKLISVDVENVANNILYHINRNDINSGYVFKVLNKMKLTAYWQDNEIRNKLWSSTEDLLIQEEI